jgi:hypothetical protein
MLPIYPGFLSGVACGTHGVPLALLIVMTADQRSQRPQNHVQQHQVQKKLQRRSECWSGIQQREGACHLLLLLLRMHATVLHTSCRERKRRQRSGFLTFLVREAYNKSRNSPRRFSVIWRCVQNAWSTARTVDRHDSCCCCACTQPKTTTAQRVLNVSRARGV